MHLRETARHMPCLVRTAGTFSLRARVHKVPTLWTHIAIMLGVAFSATMGLAAQKPDTPTKSTLYSGDFDDFLMIAANHETGLLSGYYDDGKCRFAFRDTLTPVELDQRRDFGEAYIVQSWEPAHPDRLFTTTLYSRSRDGYQGAITLEPGRNDATRPAACRWRITLDRAGNVSADYLGVRVVRKSRPKVFDYAAVRKSARMVPKRQKPLRQATGVWAAPTYLPAAATRGFVYLNWYDPPGTPQGGYVRESDLYPLPPIANP